MKHLRFALLILVGLTAGALGAPAGPPAGSPILNSHIYQRKSEMNIDTATVRSVNISTFTNAPSLPYGVMIAGALYNSAGSSPLTNLGVVNVKEYGAWGDGIHDDGAVLASAYNIVVARGGGILYIPTGTYLDSATPLVPASNVTIMGDGMRATIINWKGSGFWLDNTSTGTIMTCFAVKFLRVNCSNAGGNHFCRLGTANQTFDESNQHISCEFVGLMVEGVSPIVANTTGLKFNTMIRTRIENCLFVDFDVPWDFQKFDEGWVEHNEIESEKSYAIYLHNDTNSIVADETTFIDNHIVVTTSAIAGIAVSEAENIRFINTYMDAGGVGNVPIGYEFDTVHNVTIDGGTLNSETVNFHLNNVRNLTIANQQLQNPDQSPAPTQFVGFSYGGTTDLSGTGGPYADSTYGTIRVINCGYPIADGFKNIPGVSVLSFGKYGGTSNFGGPISDVSRLYANQILDRNGSQGVLKETGLVLSPFNANTYLNGSHPTNIAVVIDTAASTGYALKSPASNIFMDLHYPTDILPGSYELIARVKTSATVSNNFFAVYWDNNIEENYSGLTTTTNYQLINLRFNFATAASTSTVSIRIGDATKDLFLDYAVLRPCANTIAMQSTTQPDLTGVGSSSTPGFKIQYSPSLPSSGNWARGDLIFITTPTAGGYLGWTCVTSGSPGTWKTFGAITP